MGTWIRPRLLRIGATLAAVGVITGSAQRRRVRARRGKGPVVGGATYLPDEIRPEQVAADERLMRSGEGQPRNGADNDLRERLQQRVAVLRKGRGQPLEG